MKVFASHSWVRILAGACLVLVLGELCSPVKVCAGCGDYVTVGSESSDHSKPPPGKSGMGQEHRGPAKLPCDGPHCDKKPSFPPSPPTTFPVRVPDWALLVKLPLADESESLPFGSGHEILAKSHRVFLIYHPPRPAYHF